MFPKINHIYKSISILGLSFFLFGCSFLDQKDVRTSSATFSLSAAATRAAATEDSETFIDVELKGAKGGYSAKQTLALKAGSELTYTFEEVPIGAEIFASAQIYNLYENEKCVLYEGKSLVQVIQEEDNLFNVKLSIAYNSVVETSKSYIVSRPLFKLERDDRELKTNKLEFKYDDDENNRDETFTWDFDKLSDYQRARITFKGAKLKSDDHNILAFKLSKTTTGAIYYKDQMPVVADSSVYEFDINQFIGLNAIGIENFWDPERNNWSGDFSCYIEKIELIKDPDAIPMDFNYISTTTSSYVVRNPALQIGAFTNINENKITFDSRQAYFETGNSYSAAYWEFADLAQYDKIYIKLKRTDSEDSENKLILRGYTPFDYSINQMSRTSEYPTDVETEPYYKTFLDYDSVQISADVIDFKTGLDKLTAISFQNNSFINEYYGNKWAIEIEEIQLFKLGNITIDVYVPEYQDIDVAKTEQKSGGNVTGWKFTAPSGYTSYVWKINDEVQSGSAISSGGTVFTFTKPNISHGPVYYDLTLLASDGTRNDSWNCQITVNVN